MKIEDLINDFKEDLREFRVELSSFRETRGNQEHTLIRFLTRSQTAKYLSIGKSTVDYWANIGKLKRHKLEKSVRFDRQEIDEALKTGGLTRYK